MRKILTALALVGVLVPAASAKAGMIPPAPIAQSVARADAVVIGKVVSLAEKTEKAELFKGDERQMKIATVVVEDTLSGKKKKTVKVAFFPPSPLLPGAGIRMGRGSVQLAKDQEAMFFLTRHPTKKDLYVIQQYFDVVTKTGNERFAVERDKARKYAKILEEAKTILASKDATMPFESAMMLVTRYRSAPAGVTKTEAVPAGESKKLLTALAKADWNPMNVQYDTVTPQMTFFLLGLQPKDGWVAPKDGTRVPVEAKKWLEANAGKYEMKRYVRESDKKDEAEPE